MISSNLTPVGRPLIRVNYIAEIKLLKEWLTLLKIHTEDGNILALIDLALDNKKPAEEDYKRDNYNV